MAKQKKKYNIKDMAEFKKICVKEKEGPLSMYVTRKISLRITKHLVNTNVTPNHVTMFSTLLAIIAAVFYSFGSYEYVMIGLLFFFLAYMTDGIDGEIARFKHMRTKFGAYFDGVTDAIKDIVIFAGIAIGSFRMTGDPYIFLIGFFAISNVLMMNYVKAARPYKSDPDEKEFKISKKNHIGILPAVTMTIIFCSLINKAHFTLWFFAVVGIFVWLKQISTTYKKLKKDDVPF